MNDFSEFRSSRNGAVGSVVVRRGFGFADLWAASMKINPANGSDCNEQVEDYKSLG